MAPQPQTSVILAGGVVKSAFEAGAISVLTERGVVPTHVLAASSGALNGIVYSAALRAGQERQAAAQLEALWIEEGNWRHGIDFSLDAIVRRQGLATTHKLYDLMRRVVEPIAAAPAQREIAFTVVITAMNGLTNLIDGHQATTYESDQSFDAHSFASAELRERIYQVCAASAAFPILFAPADVPGIGPCADGGAVNNSPIGIAVDAGTERVILIAPTAAAVPAQGVGAGLDLASQLAEILIGERLYRDLQQTSTSNHIVAQLDDMVAQNQLSAAQATAVKQLIGWPRHVELISIRPEVALDGNMFSGLFKKRLRAGYVEAGRAAATAALAKHGIG